MELKDLRSTSFQNYGKPEAVANNDYLTSNINPTFR